MLGAEGRKAYRRVVGGKVIVDAHVFKKPADVCVKKMFYFFEVKLGIDKNRADIRFNYIGEALQADC